MHYTHFFAMFLHSMQLHLKFALLLSQNLVICETEKKTRESGFLRELGRKATEEKTKPLDKGDLISGINCDRTDLVVH